MILGGGTKICIDQVTLYFIIAPFNELLCGETVGTGTMEAYDASITTRGRRLGDHANGQPRVVYDHQCTGAFLFAEPGMRISGVHDMVREQCIAYTKSNDIFNMPNMHRSIASIKLGVVPARDTELPRIAIVAVHHISCCRRRHRRCPPHQLLSTPTSSLSTTSVVVDADIVAVHHISCCRRRKSRRVRQSGVCFSWRMFSSMALFTSSTTHVTSTTAPTR